MNRKTILDGKRVDAAKHKPAPWTNGKAGPPTTQPAPWPELIPLADEPDIAPFPLDALPEQLATYCRELTWSMNAPIDFAGVMLLGLAAGAIGNARRLRISATQSQPALIFAGMIGPPGSAKSPVLKFLTAPFDAVQERCNDEYESAMESYKAAQEAGDEAGARPLLKRVITRNTTFESLALSLQYNQRGFVWPLDELAALFCGLNQYKSGNGNDRQSLLSIWAQETIDVSRKMDLKAGLPPIFVVNPCLSIVGGIQPDMIAAIRGKAAFRGDLPPDDGGLDRFLFSWPNPMKEIGDEGRRVDHDVLTIWPNVVNKLLDLDGIGVEVALSADARQAWINFTNEHADEVNDPAFLDHLRGPWAKLKGYCARLALVVHHLRWAVDAPVNLMEMNAGTMTAAVKLVEYFKSHARKVHAMLGSDKRWELAHKVLRWIRANRAERFQKRTLFEGTKGTFRTVDALDPILDVLVSHGLIRHASEQVSAGPGRKPSPWIETNPGLWTDSQNSQNSHKSAREGDSANCANSAKRAREEQSEDKEASERIPTRKRGSI